MRRERGVEVLDQELEIALAAMLDDPVRRERFGRAGRERVLEKFSWHAVAVATAAAYERAVSTGSTNDPPLSTSGTRTRHTFRMDDLARAREAVSSVACRRMRSSRSLSSAVRYRL